MAKTFLTNINLKGNQLLNAVIHSASTAPSALSAGQLYFNTGDSTFYYSTGTGTGNWSPVGVQYISTVGSNLSVTGGELDLGANVVITDSTQTLSNKTISGPLYFTDNVTVANEGEIVINSDNNNFEITAVTNDLILGSNNGNIILSADSDIYKGSINSDNRIATFADITSDLTGFVTETGTQTLTNKTIQDVLVTGTTSFRDPNGDEQLTIDVSTIGTAHLIAADDLSLRATNDIVLYPGNDAGGQTGKAYIHWGNDATNAHPEREITTAGNIQNLTNKTVTDSLHFKDGANDYSAIYASGTDLDIDGSNNIVLSTNNGNIILNPNGSAYIGSAVADNKVVKFSDLTAVQSGLSWKQAVNLLVNVDVPIGADFVGASYDGHPAFDITNAGYRLLLIGQTTSTENGIYELVADGSVLNLVRSADADTDEKLKGAAVFVEEGTVYGATAWVQQNHYVTGFADQNWVQFSGQGTYIGSNSILVDGNEISVILDSDSLEVTGSGLKVNYHTDGGLDNDSGLYVKTADGVHIDSSGNVAADYTAIESQLVTDGFVKSTDISNVTRKYTGTITGETDTSPYTFSHGLGTNDVVVRVYQTSSGADQWSDVEVDVKRSSDGNSVTIAFATDPVAGENYNVVIIG